MNIIRYCRVGRCASLDERWPRYCFFKISIEDDFIIWLGRSSQSRIVRWKKLYRNVSEFERSSIKWQEGSGHRRVERNCYESIYCFVEHRETMSLSLILEWFPFEFLHHCWDAAVSTVVGFQKSCCLSMHYLKRGYKIRFTGLTGSRLSSDDDDILWKKAT